MLNIKLNRGPVSIAALCVVSLFGLKDTGILVSDHVQPTYSGNNVYFEEGEKAEIINLTKDGYIVAKGKAKVTVPVEKIQLLEKTVKTYKVTKTTSIKDSNNNVIRNLFIGEKVEVISEDNDTFNVECQDGKKGDVVKSALTFVSEKTVKVDQKNYKNTKKVEQKPAVAKTEAPKNFDDKKTSAKANDAVNSALNKLGSTYVYGATGQGGYDCSGLVYAVYNNEFGISIPRTSRELSQFGQQVDKSELRRGDLVFFNTTGGGVSHVGIYMGNNEFVHASSGAGKVIVSNLSEKYYSTRYVNATRICK